ncbi:MAG: adenylyl-sulfate kinase [Desulfomicrobium escambiense]|nr:adenylyl-sulfate kinase [Desulfomicrobium escambiense]
MYRSLVYTARILSDLGHHVIIDATGNRRQWRDFARASVSRFAEIYLRCPLDVCMAREVSRKDRHDAPPGLYRKGMDGAPVPGLQVPYEEPLNAELVIETDEVSIDDAGVLIKRFITERIARRTIEY